MLEIDKEIRKAKAEQITITSMFGVQNILI